MRNQRQVQQAPPVLSAIGDSDGWLVLRFERRLDQTADEVWQALRGGQHRDHGIPCGLAGVVPNTGEPPLVFEWCPGTDTVRWEVERAAGGSRLAMTAWIDSDDPDVRASTGAGYHSCFEQLVATFDAGPDEASLACTDLSALTDHYLAALASMPVHTATPG